MTTPYNAIIIGAGVIGAATAYALARKGWKTLNLDKLPAAGYGSTSGSCAIIRPYYSTVDGSALAYESHFYWQEWADFLGVADDRGLARYVDCGCIVMKTEHNGYLRSACRIMDAIGAPYQELSADELKARLPFYQLDTFAPAKRPDDPGFGEPNGGRLDGAVLFPTGGYVTDPQLAAHNLQVAAEARGAAFRFGVEVGAVRQAGGRVAGVTLTDGEAIDAPVVVNVAGPHSAKVNAMAGVDQGMKVKTRALKQEVVHVPAPDRVDYGYVTSDSDIGCYMRPEHGGNILIGSEDPECDPREWVDPDGWDRGFSEQARIQAMRAAQRIPELGVPNNPKGVVELYDVSDDWIPIYDKSDLPGFYMAVGSSGNQFKNAPVAGEMMADLIEACEAGRDHDAEPVSFHLHHIDHTLDVGFFSRRREVNPDSSFSVLG